MDATTWIEPECINADLEADSQGATACRPLQDGAACWPGSVCHRGLCGGADELGIKMESAAVAALTKGGSDADAPPKKDDKKPDPKKQDAVKKDDKKPPQPQPAVKKPPSPPPPSPPPPPPPPPQATYMSGGRLVVYDIPLPSPPAPAQPVAGWATVASVVESKAKLTRVPQTFLATSHEWDRMMDYANNVAAFKNIFREFGPSPIIRVGGATQDRMVGQPATEIWVALRKMHEAFNARFLIGLPLLPSDSIERAKTMMKTVEKYIPKKALLGYELGNEPEFWPDSVGGFKAKDPKKFVPGFDAYAEYFDRVATAINGCPKNGSAPNPMLSGPGWGNVNTIDAKWLSKHARMKGAKCYMRELSVHP
ncbi:hypothetical protein MNEG_14394 [Monoraphidium neglectum]|uniref:Uncharacterized protein n=1 Tax=Monoraphidium neglectum TaxID=145388 RepID=A0A0D2LP84_9CHLO|nr:hypothetical protein MNEG_14394 [Monoraphidium neglectum]KIY93569.1 hypothetical protein MNEG_14394 [Monoraphidium neglectum]|eukprot:XP_013892589.1 hypothetical protein MNEG_14394 [Monoraphidium neglectum]